MAQPTPLAVIDARRCTLKQLREQAGRAFLDGPRRYRVAELEGPLLDLAVARAEGEPATIHLIDNPIAPFYECAVLSSCGRLQRQYLPSRDWTQGGPIIERERITLSAPTESGTFASAWCADTEWGRPCGWEGSTPLVAAMRAFVAVKLGEEVEL